MAQLGPFPVEFGAVFPSGAYAAGGVEKVRDFDRSSGDRVVQQADKATGLPLWVVAGRPVPGRLAPRGRTRHPAGRRDR